MSTVLLPDDLPKLLRSHGLKVVVVPGWRIRRTNSWTAGFDPVGVLCHHTATPKSWALAMVLRLLIRGRPGLSGPLCQIGLGRDGTVYIIAAGRANHAGTAKAVGTVSAGDGNYLYVGIEAFNDGVGEPWPAVQYNAYVLLCAVLSKKVTGSSVRTVAAHKETSTTGKIDPRFDMGKFRANVAEKMASLDKQKPAPKRKKTRGKMIDSAVYDLKAAKGGEARAKKIQAALAILLSIAPLKKRKDKK